MADEDEDGEPKWPPLYETNEPVSVIRPAPPEADTDARAAWVKGLRPGDAMDLRFDGGWWEVELLSVSASDPASPDAGEPLYTVRAVNFDIEHVVPIEELRPPHKYEITDT